MTPGAAAREGRNIDPAITIAIPVFEREELVRKALESALRQPAADLEILVVDNASTDRTWEVLNSYRDPRLRLVRNERNLGLFGNFNRCIFLARGRYVTTLCSDDMLLDGFLEPARKLLDVDPEVGMVSSRGRAVDPRRGTTFPLGGNLPAGIYAREDAIAAALWAFSTFYVNPFNYPSGILMRTAVA
ncbi:MAG: glycosyltransferase family 2 protein, partial [Candidatus Eisenbacteria bacterium]